MAVNSGFSTLVASPGSALNSSAFRLSCPGAFSFFRDLMAEMISSFSGGSMLISRSASASCMSASTAGGGLLRISVKCSAHRFSISVLVKEVVPVYL